MKIWHGTTSIAFFCNWTHRRQNDKERIINEREHSTAGPSLTAVQEFLHDLWEEHVRCEFTSRNAEDTLATMVEDAYVNHIPVLTGSVGREELREFYSNHFIPQMPPDTEMIPISRTIGNDQVVDEMVFRFPVSK